MARRGSPFARIARAAERAEAHARAARPPHLRHLSPSDYAAARAREALEALRADRVEEEHARSERVAGLSRGAVVLADALRKLGNAATVIDARLAFDILADDADEFDRALAELARHALVDVGPSLGSDGGPAAPGVVSLRLTGVAMPEKL